jgi:RNA polymerase sigma-70 factor (ECF subfamily)
MNLATIIRDAKEGNDAARQHLVSTMKGPMMGLCKRYIKESRDAEETMLDGFYQCLMSLSGFKYESDAMFYGWLKSIMIQECLKHSRRKQTVILLPEIDPDEVVLESEAVDRLSAKEIVEQIDELPAGYRTVFNLYVIDGMEHKEIAELLGIKESTSRSQLTKAKVCLQKILILNGHNHVRDRSILE